MIEILPRFRNNKCNYKTDRYTGLYEGNAMKIGEHNYIQQLRRQNEKALMYVIETYGGLLMSVIRRHLFSLPHKQE